MKNIKFDIILNRQAEKEKIIELLQNINENKHNLLFKKGIYIYGEPGTGKTEFVMNILRELDYDAIKYDAGDIRNKTIIDTITQHNMSDKNIMSIFQKKVKKIAIVMDEIDGMNNGDKGGINMLIKLIRPKKTKKQKLEEITLNPIICISNYHIDKKIKELMNVCNVIELKLPTKEQMNGLLDTLMPKVEVELKQHIIQFIQYDLRKLIMINNIYQNNNELLTIQLLEQNLQIKSYNDDTKKITYKLMTNNYSIQEHNTVMNETDRTIVGLLWHENIIDVIEKMKKSVSIPFYLKILHNMCFSDYIDRITFQKQIWQFNEMSSLIKTFKNNKLLNDSFKKKPKNSLDIRFTKVLTKYSTEYNNIIFIQYLCQQLNMCKSDLFLFFLDLKTTHTDLEIISLLENDEITKLDINRIYKYLDKYTKENINIDTCDDVLIEEFEYINDPIIE
jgi:DNA polymerase III delta prime subunit